MKEKSDRQIWYEIGQAMRAKQERAKANECEQRHIEGNKAQEEINPAIAPKLREALEIAKIKSGGGVK